MAVEKSNKGERSWGDSSHITVSQKKVGFELEQNEVGDREECQATHYWRTVSAVFWSWLGEMSPGANGSKKSQKAKIK